MKLIGIALLALTLHCTAQEPAKLPSKADGAALLSSLHVAQNAVDMWTKRATKDADIISKAQNATPQTLKSLNDESAHAVEQRDAAKAKLADLEKSVSTAFGAKVLAQLTQAFEQESTAPDSSARRKASTQYTDLIKSIEATLAD